MATVSRRWHDLDDRRRRLIEIAAAAVVVVIFLATGYASFAILLAIVFAIAFAPEEWRSPRVGRFRLPVILLLALVLAIAYPYLLPHLGKVPIFNNFPGMSTAITMLVFTMMAIGLNMVVGYAGLLDLGYVAFYAMGAYVAGWLASPQFAKHTFHFGAAGVPSNFPGIHVNVWLVLVVAGLLTALIGVVIGLPTLRLRGDYLAIVTLGFGEILPQIARNGDNLFGFNLTNGAQGINPIDQPGFGSNPLGLPSNYVTASNQQNLFFWTAIGLLLFTVFCSWRLRDSRLGRAWIAIREDEVAAAAMGIPLMRTKTWSYASGAFFGGIAGAFYASEQGGTFPDNFSFNISVFILCMVILGGMGSIWGCIVGGLFLAYLNQDGLGNVGGWLHTTFGITIDLPKYAFGIYGLIILLVMLLRPQGLIGSRRRRAELERGVQDTPLYDVAA